MSSLGILYVDEATLTAACERRARQVAHMRAAVPARLMTIVLSLVPFLLFVGPLSADEPSGGNVIQQFKVHGDGDALLVPVSVANKSHLFVFDTGSTLTTFDRSFRPLLGTSLMTADSNSPNGESQVELFRPPEAMLGVLNLAEGVLDPINPVLCENLDNIRKATGCDIRGLIGTPFLLLRIVEVDFDRGILSFLRSVPKDCGKRVALGFDDGVITVDVAFPAREGREVFMLDTGMVSQTGSLKPELARALESHGLARKIAGDKTWSIDVGGAVRQSQYEIEAMEVSGFVHRKMLVFDHAGDIPNSLGLGYLSRYNVIFDFPNRSMYLKPNKRFGAPDIDYASGPARLGMYIVSDDGEATIWHVSPKSPAAAAGLRIHDVLLTIGGVDVARERLNVINNALYHCQGATELVVLRGTTRRRMFLSAPERAHVGGTTIPDRRPAKTRSRRERRHGRDK